MPGLWPSDDIRLIATEVGECIEALELKAGEPRSDGVQALSAAGVADHISKRYTS
jgi:hypothetical protein